MEFKVKDLAGHPCGMLWSLRFTEGGVDGLEEPGLSRAPDGEGWTWTHFPLGDARAHRFLAGRPDLPAGLKTLIQEDEERVQLIAQEPWLYGVLPDFERDLGGKALEPARLIFACDGQRLLTARRRALCGLDRVRHDAERGGGQITGPTAVIAAQVLQYLELMEDKIEDLGDTLDHVEDAVLGERADLDGRALGPLRRRLASYRRELGGLRNALHRLQSPRAGRRGAAPAAFTDLPGPIDDVDREAASLQDRARLLHEELDTLINSATNRSMRALTILSTLLIPPTLIVGAWGMNVPGIPWGASKGGFFAVSLFCLAVVVGAWMALKRARML